MGEADCKEWGKQPGIHAIFTSRGRQCKFMVVGNDLPHRENATKQSFGGAEADLEGNWYNRTKGGTWWPWDTMAWCCSSLGRVLAYGEEDFKKAWKTNKQANIIGNWIKLLFFVETETKSSWKETKSLYVTWKPWLSIDKNLKLLSLLLLERRIGLLLLQLKANHFIHWMESQNKLLPFLPKTPFSIIPLWKWIAN